jgi:hypothetical protein
MIVNDCYVFGIKSERQMRNRLENKAFRGTVNGGSNPTAATRFAEELKVRSPAT